MTKLALVLVMCSGCALLFQERLSDHYDPGREPRCSTTPGWYLWDGLIAVSEAAVLAADANGNVHLTSQEQLVAAAVGVVHLVSAVRGYGWVGDCEAAREAYDRGPQMTAQTSRRLGVTTPDPVGWLCMDSAATPAAGQCARLEAACVDTRALRIARAPDLTPCAPAEVAWCFRTGDGRLRCSPRRDACDAQLAAAGVDGACEETR